jgi:hypothetical protein
MSNIDRRLVEERLSITKALNRTNLAESIVLEPYASTLN